MRKTHLYKNDDVNRTPSLLSPKDGFIDDFSKVLPSLLSPNGACYGRACGMLTGSRPLLLSLKAHPKASFVAKAAAKAAAKAVPRQAAQAAPESPTTAYIHSTRIRNPTC